MAGKKIFNSDVEIQGKEIIYTVPNATGTVLTYNPTTKEVSTRTNAEIISDLNLATQTWVSNNYATIGQLGNYVTTNTVQNIDSIKNFRGAVDNTYTGASIRIDGNGSADTIFPTLAFHQPSLYAGTLQYRGSAYGFYFMNITGDSYEKVKANGFVKAGSDDNYVLLGGGSHKAVSDFVNNITSSTDADAITETGYAYGTVNMPDFFPSDKSGTLLHKQFNSNYATQMAISYVKLLL